MVWLSIGFGPPPVTEFGQLPFFGHANETLLQVKVMAPLLHYPLALTFVIDNRMVSCLAHYESPIPIGPRYNRVADEVLVALSIGSRLSFADQMLRLRAFEGIHHFEDFICIHR